MPAYCFEIQRIGGRAAEEAGILACDDGEAFDLGRIRLLTGPDVERITIKRRAGSPLVLTRDLAPVTAGNAATLPRYNIGADNGAASINRGGRRV